MSEHLTTGARESIRIAESVYPADLRRQEALAKEIITAINRCEQEFAVEIIQRLRAGSRDPVGPLQGCDK